jgi:hypothetical protein
MKERKILRAIKKTYFFLVPVGWLFLREINNFAKTKQQQRLKLWK